MEHSLERISVMNNNDEKESETSDHDNGMEELIINCVKTNNVRFLNLLLYEPESHLNSIYYGENMLMLAIRLGHENMARFLIENEVDYNFKKVIFYKTIVDQRETMDFYYINCREMAYRHEMYDIVEIIDFLNKKYFRFCSEPKLKMRNRSEKPGMFHDVISLHEEFFTGEYFNRDNYANILYCKPDNVDRVNLVNVDRVKSVNVERHINQSNAKENKSSFLRKRTTSAKSKSGRRKNEK